MAALVLGFGVFIWRPKLASLEFLIRSNRPVSLGNLGLFFSGVLVMELLLWLALGALPPRLESVAAGFNEWLRPGSGQSEVQSGGSGQRTGGHWLINRTRMRPLPERTNLKPGNRPEVFVQPRVDPAAFVDDRLYVHAFALSEFRDGAWRVGGRAAWEIEAGEDGWVSLNPSVPEEWVQCRVYHSAQKDGDNLVLGLQGLAAVEMPRVAEVDQGLHLLPELDEEALGYQYDSRSSPVLLDDLVDVEARVPDEVPERLLELPGGVLGFRISDLARLVQGEGEVVDRLMRIRNHLRTTLDYSLVTENPDGRDPLENFLFHEQRGHCEFFATAGALLARAAGVPSRVCYGWSGGTYYQVSGYYVFRANEAHAWTEVFLEDWGWVVLDPTPPDGLAAEAPRVAGEDEVPPGLDEEVLTDDLVDDGGAVVIPLALLLAGLPTLWFLLRNSINRRTGFGVKRPATVARPALYRELFVSGCRARGVRVKAGATLRSLGASLDEMPAFFAEMVDYHYGVAYEGRAVDSSFEKTLEKMVRVWVEEGA